MTHVWAVILGVLQGLAEFLPISSTAHLKLVPWLFQVRNETLSSPAFDIALHAGSLLAIIAALWRDWVDLVVGAVGGETARHRAAAAEGNPDPLLDPSFARKFLGFLLLTSIPGAIFGVLFDKKLEFLSTPYIPGATNVGVDQKFFVQSPLLLGVCLIVFGVILWAADKFVTRKEPLTSMTWVKALAIGAAQAVALIPGVSRSGSTMTAGRLAGIEREAVARYSFMAAAPIIAGAAVFGLREPGVWAQIALDPLTWILGFVAAAITSVLVMRWMLSYVKRHSFSAFMWYRIAFGVLVIATYFVHGGR
jgi:undecaprenyl-diphosphatase